MMDKLGGVILSIITGIIGLSIVAVVVSQKAQAPQVLQAASTGLASVISAAVAPVTGNTEAAAAMSALTSPATF